MPRGKVATSSSELAMTQALGVLEGVQPARLIRAARGDDYAIPTMKGERTLGRLFPSAPRLLAVLKTGTDVSCDSERVRALALRLVTELEPAAALPIMTAMVKSSQAVDAYVEVAFGCFAELTGEAGASLLIRGLWRICPRSRKRWSGRGVPPVEFFDVATWSFVALPVATLLTIALPELERIARLRRPGYAHCELASALLHGLLGRGRAVPWAQLTHLPEVTRDLELARILEDAIVHGRVVRR